MQNADQHRIASAGARLERLRQLAHPIDDLSFGCADVFGADEQDQLRMTANAIPGTSGLTGFLASSAKFSVF